MSHYKKIKVILTLYFQFGADFGKIFPIKNEWSNFKFGRTSALFRLTEKPYRIRHRSEKIKSWIKRINLSSRKGTEFIPN